MDHDVDRPAPPGLADEARPAQADTSSGKIVKISALMIPALIVRTGRPGRLRSACRAQPQRRSATGTSAPLSRTSRSLAGFASTAATVPWRLTGSTDDLGTDQFVDPEALGVGPANGSARNVAPARLSCRLTAVRRLQSAPAIGPPRAPPYPATACDLSTTSWRPCALERATRCQADSSTVVTRPTTTSPLSPCGRRDVAYFEQHGAAQSAMSTKTSSPSRAAAARVTARIACAVRPRRPITRPTSPGPTCKLSRTGWPSAPPLVSTPTASGSSTRWRGQVLEHGLAVPPGTRL